MPAPDETPYTPSEDEPQSSPRLRTGGRAGAGLAAALFVALVAVFAVTWFGRVIRAPGPVLVVAVTLLPFLYASLATAIFSAWSFFPDRRSLPIELMMVVTAAAVVWGPSFPARPQAAIGTEITAMSWNIQRLWGGDSGSDPRACVLDEVLRVDPDVLTLLEVSAEAAADLQQTLGLTCVHTDYYGTGSERSGGLAVCVRRDVFSVSGTGQRFFDGDDWQYVSTEVRGHGRQFNVLAVHLQPYWPLTGDKMRQSVSDLALGETQPLLEVSRDGSTVVARQGAQSAALLDRVSRFVDPTLLAGDFNSTRDSSLHTTLRRSFVDTFARGGRGFGNTVVALDWLPLRVDYIYATPDFAVVHSEVGPANCSDHRPVVSKLVLRHDER